MAITSFGGRDPDLIVPIAAKDEFSNTFKKFKGAGTAALMAVGVAAAATTAALAKLVISTAAAGDQFQKMALRTGFAVQSLSELAHAAELSGTNIQQLEVGFRKLAKNMSDAQIGLATQKRAFDELGIQVEDFEGNLKSTEVVFNEIIVSLSKLQNETKQAALAQEFFGRSGAALLPLIKAGATAIGEMRREARELGITFDQEAADQAALFTDNMLRLEQSVIGAGRALAISLMPAVNDVLNGLLKVNSFFKNDISELMSKLLFWRLRGIGGGAGAGPPGGTPSGRTTGRFGEELGYGPGDQDSGFSQEFEIESLERFKRSMDAESAARLQYQQSRIASQKIYAAELQMAEDAAHFHRGAALDAALTAEGETIARFQESKNSLVFIGEALQTAFLKQENDKRLAHDKKVTSERQQIAIHSASAIVNTLDALNTLSQGRHRSQFEALKVARIAQATINTYAGANAVLADPNMTNPALKFAAVAATITLGLAQVAAISQTSFGGTGGATGGSASFSGGQDTFDAVGNSNQAQEQAPQQVTINVSNLFGEDDVDSFTEKVFIPALERAGDRDVQITVTKDK